MKKEKRRKRGLTGEGLSPTQGISPLEDMILVEGPLPKQEEGQKGVLTLVGVVGLSPTTPTKVEVESRWSLDGMESVEGESMNRGLDFGKVKPDQSKKAVSDLEELVDGEAIQRDKVDKGQSPESGGLDVVLPNESALGEQRNRLCRRLWKPERSRRESERWNRKNEERKRLRRLRPGRVREGVRERRGYKERKSGIVGRKAMKGGRKKKRQERGLRGSRESKKAGALAPRGAIVKVKVGGFPFVVGIESLTTKVVGLCPTTLTKDRAKTKSDPTMGGRSGGEVETWGSREMENGRPGENRERRARAERMRYRRESGQKRYESKGVVIDPLRPEIGRSVWEGLRRSPYAAQIIGEDKNDSAQMGAFVVGLGRVLGRVEKGEAQGAMTPGALVGLGGGTLASIRGSVRKDRVRWRAEKRAQRAEREEGRETEKASRTSKWEKFWVDQEAEWKKADAEGREKKRVRVKERKDKWKRDLLEGERKRAAARGLGLGLVVGHSPTTKPSPNFEAKAKPKPSKRKKPKPSKSKKPKQRRSLKASGVALGGDKPKEKKKALRGLKGEERESVRREREKQKRVEEEEKAKKKHQKSEEKAKREQQEKEEKAKKKQQKNEEKAKQEREEKAKKAQQKQEEKAKKAQKDREDKVKKEQQKEELRERKKAKALGVALVVSQPKKKKKRLWGLVGEERESVRREREEQKREAKDRADQKKRENTAKREQKEREKKAKLEQKKREKKAKEEQQEKESRESKRAGVKEALGDLSEPKEKKKSLQGLKGEERESVRQEREEQKREEKAKREKRKELKKELRDQMKEELGESRQRRRGQRKESRERHRKERKKRLRAEEKKEKKEVKEKGEILRYTRQEERDREEEKERELKRRLERRLKRQSVGKRGRWDVRGDLQWDRWKHSRAYRIDTREATKRFVKRSVRGPSTEKGSLAFKGVVVERGRGVGVVQERRIGRIRREEGDGKEIGREQEEVSEQYEGGEGRTRGVSWRGGVGRVDRASRAPRRKTHREEYKSHGERIEEGRGRKSRRRRKGLCGFGGGEEWSRKGGKRSCRGAVYARSYGMNNDIGKEKMVERRREKWVIAQLGGERKHTRDLSLDLRKGQDSGLFPDKKRGQGVVPLVSGSRASYVEAKAKPKPQSEPYNHFTEVGLVKEKRSKRWGYRNVGDTKEGDGTVGRRLYGEERVRTPKVWHKAVWKTKRYGGGTDEGGGAWVLKTVVSRRQFEYKQLEIGEVRKTRGEKVNWDVVRYGSSYVEAKANPQSEAGAIAPIGSYIFSGAMAIPTPYFEAKAKPMPQSENPTKARASEDSLVGLVGRCPTYPYSSKVGERRAEDRVEERQKVGRGRSRANGRW